MSEQIESTTTSIRRRIDGFSPEAGIILGSGMGGLVEDMEIQHAIPYEEIEYFPKSTVEGHSGCLIFGSIEGRRVIAMQGRFHYYEGYSMREITLPVRVMQMLGVKTLFVSNASGGMNPDFKVGDLMIISDHINLFPDSPLIGKNDERLGPRFVDMSETYSRRLIKLALEIASEKGLQLREGVYAGLTGPCFETPAEYRYLRRIGADAVGMSTVPEVIVARHAGMEVFGISIITDLGIEGEVEKVSHEEVLRVANERAAALSKIVGEMLKRL